MSADWTLGAGKCSTGHRTVMVFGQGGSEIGGGNMVWTSLVSTPLDEETIASSAALFREPTWSGGPLDFVVGDVQALMQPLLINAQ